MSVLVHYQFTQSHLFNVRAACWVNHQVHTERFYFLWLSKHPCKCNMWFWRSCFYFHSFYLALFELKKVPSSPFRKVWHTKRFDSERFGFPLDYFRETHDYREAVAQKCFFKMVFSKISQNSQEAPVSHFFNFFTFFHFFKIPSVIFVKEHPQGTASL